MKVIVARHAETNYNVLGLHNADPSVDVHLTKKGITQAKELAEKLKNKKIDLIITSELKRTHQTASIVNEYHNAPIINDPLLNDIDAGFEGEKVENYHAIRDKSENVFDFKIDGFESPRDVYERTDKFLNKLKKRSESTVLIVTSKHNFRHIRSIRCGHDPSKKLACKIENASCFIFDF